MKRIALIVSLKFRAAHISHLVASYKQMEELGYRSVCYIHPDAIPFLPDGIEYITDLSEIKSVAIAIFWFPAISNIKAMLTLKYRYKAKILYVYHEPIEPFRQYIKSGNSVWWTIKFYCKYYISLIFILLANKVILPSEKAIELYRNNITKWINSNFTYLPLLYDDEQTPNLQQGRYYFSYIGGISSDHAFDKYIDFIYAAFKNKDLTSIKFLIATWQSIPNDHRILEMEENRILTVHSGSPMTNEEINFYYASSYLVWNAYNRSTQSGVLAKAFMFGTPGLILRKNISEFVKDRREVIAIDSNTDFTELLNAIQAVIDDFDSFSKNARENFERNYLYSIHNEKMKQILTSI